MVITNNSGYNTNNSAYIILYMVINDGIYDHTGWWLKNLPLWNMMKFVSWDDDIPN